MAQIIDIVKINRVRAERIRGFSTRQEGTKNVKGDYVVMTSAVSDGKDMVVMTERYINCVKKALPLLYHSAGDVFSANQAEVVVSRANRVRGLLKRWDELGLGYPLSS